jgi:hypothetical protein
VLYTKVKNCIIINTSINGGSALKVTNNGTNYFSNTTIQNNSIEKAYLGVWVNCNYIRLVGNETLITENDFTSSGANTIKYMAIDLVGEYGVTVSNNNIANMSGTPSGVDYIAGICIDENTLNATVTGNTISNFSLSGTNISPVGIMVNNHMSNFNISNNTITGITTSGGGTPHGIYVYYTDFISEVTVSNNKVSNINNTSTQGNGSRGIIINTGRTSSNVNVYNNFIWDVKGTGYTPSSCWIIGLGIDGATGGVNIYHNSVNLYGAYSGYNAATTSCAFAVLNSSATSLNIRNNIFSNTFDNTNSSTDKSYSIYTATSNIAFTDINYNDYYVSGTPSILGYLSSNRLTLTNWQTATGKDGNSKSVDPTFFSTSNLHTWNSDLYSAGVTISGFTTDIDGDTRGTPPCIGADEFQPMVYNQASKSSVYPNSTNNQILRIDFPVTEKAGTLYLNSIEFTSLNSNDADIQTNGVKLYRTSDTTFSTVNQLGSSVSFSGGKATFSGLNYNLPGNSTTYIWLTYDVASNLVNGNVLDAKIEANKININDVLSPSSEQSPPGNRIIKGMMSGTYAIGTGLFNKITGKKLYQVEKTRKIKVVVPMEETDGIENISNKKQDIKYTEKKVEEKYYELYEGDKPYKGKLHVRPDNILNKKSNEKMNFDSYNEVFADIPTAISELNIRGVSGPITFEFTDAAYTTSQLTINAVSGSSAMNTITFKPKSGATVIISGSSTSIFKLYGADYIIIDGSNSGGTDRSLTISNTSTASSTAAIWISSLGAGSGATNNIIKNCKISCGTNSTSLENYGISLSGSSTPQSIGYDNDSITIQNNSISKTVIGIYANGYSTGEFNNLIISGNTIGSNNASEYITFRGIYGRYLSGSVITNNEIFNLIENYSRYGIYFEQYVYNSIISKNKIHSFNHSDNMNYYECIGIYFSQSSGCNNNQLDNNLIYDLLNYGISTQGFLCGIRITGGSGYKIYYNSINLSGALRSSINRCYAQCFYISSTSTNLDIRNNILYNIMTGNIIKNYAIDIAASSTFSNCNYNDFYSSGTVLGRFAGNEKANLSEWRTATSQDIFSVSAVPGFTSSTDLSINTSNTNCWNINGGAYPISTIISDIAGNPRSSVLSTRAADIGAYEFTPEVASPNLSISGLPPVDGATSIITFAGTTLSVITWHSGSGTLPSSIAAVFEPQVNPPNSYGNFANENLTITSTGGSGYTYDIVYYYNLARQYTISSEANFRLAKYDISTGWVQLDATPNTTTKSITITGLTSFSSFSFGDANNPLPVNIKSFTSNVSERNVKLTWVTEKENNNKGFEIQRANANSQNPEFIKIGYASSLGNNPNQNIYTFKDNKLSVGKYNYRLKQIDINGNFTYFNLSSIVEIELPKEFRLSQNYPNPFNPISKIDYDLAVDTKVRFVIYDMLGREIKILVNENQKAEYYTIEFNATNFASGVYFYRIQAGDFISTKRMVLVK